MTVIRVPDGDGFVYFDPGLYGASGAPGAEEGVWTESELFTHLMLIAAAAQALHDAETVGAEAFGQRRELAARLAAYHAYNDARKTGSPEPDAVQPDRYTVVIYRSPVSGADGWAVWDTLEDHEYSWRKTRDAAEDDAGVMNHGPGYRPRVR